MSKSTLDTGFRKIDVDAFAEDQYCDDEDVETPGIGPDEQQVNQMLQSNKLTEALKVALRNPPLKTKNQAIKDRAAALVVRVMCSFRQSEIESAVQGLTADEQDLLMKYVYKGMEKPVDANCASLLTWHEKLHAVGGNGMIVRIFCDRRRL